MDDIGVVDESTWFYQQVVKRRIPWGFALAALFLVFAEPSRTSVLFGFWIALAGEALRTWSSGTLVKNEQLTTEGPYQLTRNPLYVGNFLLGVGVAVMGGALWLLLVFALFFWAVYQALILKEEKRMLERYGEEFYSYCREVPRFFPRWEAWPPAAAPYDPRRMWQVHKEWKAWLALYAATLYLLLRAV